MKRKYRICLLLLMLTAGEATACSAPAAVTVNGIRAEDMTEASGPHPAPGQEPVVPESGAEGKIAVYVCGAVNRPAVYRLPADARVVDALKAAEGFSRDADTEWINQARSLTDGEMLRVYTLAETYALRQSGAEAGERGTADGSPAAAGASGTKSGGRVNLNTASKEQLMTLPGIGEAKAEAILRRREESGPFTSCEDVMQVSGIKKSIYEKIRDRITV